MSLVLDGSAALAWCFEDECTPEVDALMMQVATEGAIVPSLWRLEIANGMQMAVRRGRLTATRRDALLSALADLQIVSDSETDRFAWSTTIRLAEERGLTAYDASYLELARRLSLPIASLDNALCRAARAIGLSVLGNSA